MISIPGKNRFSTSLPGNGTKDVSARICSQTTEEQANTISINQLSKIGILGFWLYSLKTRGKKVVRPKQKINHEHVND